MVEVLGIGAPFLDHVIHVSDSMIASLGSTKGGMKFINKAELDELLTLPSTPVPGGSCANVLRALASLGHHTALLGIVGSDAEGLKLEIDLKNVGVETHLQKVDLPTGQLICLVTPDGERTFRTFLSSSTAMWSLDLNAVDFSNVSLVHIEGYCLLYGSLVSRALQKAKKEALRVSFDLANFELVQQYKNELIPLLSNYVDIVFANEAEVKALTGLTPKEGCNFLKNLCPVAIVSISEQGCWVGQGETLMHCPTFPTIPIDTTGAGDLFAAGFLHGFLTNLSLSESARYGALLASEIVQVHGATLPPERLVKIKKFFND